MTAPDGTVCLATTPTGALIEKIWDPGRADPDDPDPQLVDLRTLRSVVMWQSDERPPHGLVADLTHQTDGLPKEFCTAAYETTQEWADAVRAEGAAGIVHWLRLDPADGRCTALFATGPDDGAPGFQHEAFPLVAAGRGDDYAGKLPTLMFRVMSSPPDEEIEEGDIADIPFV